MNLSALKGRIQTDHPSIVLVFMSHGVREGILGVDRSVVTTEEIKDIFSGRNCPALIGKPKIMFFQACRGGNVNILLLSYNKSLAGLLIWIKGLIFETRILNLNYFMEYEYIFISVSAHEKKNHKLEMLIYLFLINGKRKIYLKTILVSLRQD